jgi:curli production assembly/transport component CsgF
MLQVILQRGRPTVFMIGILVLMADGASATDLVYVPVNSSFGGNPINGSVLLNGASATNKHQAPAAQTPVGAAQQTPLEQFNSLLERSILNQLAAGAASKISVAGKLVPGTLETANFSITIADLGGGTLKVTTTDKATGVVTSFEVSQ